MDEFKRSIWFRVAAAIWCFQIGWLGAGIGFVFAAPRMAWPMWHLLSFFVLAFVALMVVGIGRARHRAWSKEHSR
ncbi:hypothetical protein AB0B45_43630 [Nonomuraea sp. NPDC049152]|uniref:hypothetical protein n=1 Tax=Nonomuraea sp. NPDC049152 TaxID=3154350 RepID=UPI0033F16DAB